MVDETNQSSKANTLTQTWEKLTFTRIREVAAGIFLGLAFGLITAVVYNWIGVAALVFPLVFPLVFIFVHDYCQRGRWQKLRRLTPIVSLGMAFVLVVTAIVYGGVLPLFVLDIFQPEIASSMGLGGLMYIVSPLFFALLLASLWWYVGFERRVSYMVYFWFIGLVLATLLISFSGTGAFLIFIAMVILFVMLFFLGREKPVKWHGLSPVPLTLILGVVAITAIYLYQMWQLRVDYHQLEDRRLSIPQALITPEIFPSTLPVSSVVVLTVGLLDSSNWTTYTDPDLGFSIKYPADLMWWKKETLTGVGSEPGNLAVRFYPTAMLTGTPGGLSDFFLIVSKETNSQGLSLTKPRDMFGRGPLIQYGPEMLTGVNIYATSLGSLPAYRMDGCCAGEGSVEADIMTVQKGQVYEIRINPLTARGIDSQSKNIYETMLSTFRIL